jgi:transcriptional regulator with GAF, ATPase, and Fis domain
MAERTKSQSTPPPDLMRERDEVLQSFSRGARFTEHFVAEYSRLRDRVLELEGQNEQLRAQLAADDAVARLLTKVENLEDERRELLRRTEIAERAQDQFDERFGEVEGEFSSLANLFVASNQLHASLTPRGVVRRIKEILAQLVGAECYAMFMAASDGETLVPIASEGIPGDRLLPVAMNGTRIGNVVQGGKAAIDEDRDASKADFDAPVVVVPLAVDDTTVGAIVVYATLEQKSRFTHTDFELFKLLGQHAAAALVGAALFEQAGRKLPGAEAFRDLSV